MQNNRVIGGEFDLDINALEYKQNNNGFLNGLCKYSSGRSALYYILLDIQRRYCINKIYLPDYLCSSVIIAAEKSQINFVFYNLNDQLEIDTNNFILKTDEKAAVLIINYFGLKNLKSQIAFVRSLSNNVIIIEDDVQAFYEFQKTDRIADYMFTSLRKTFPCPDGGVVWSKNKINSVNDSNMFHQYKLAGSILKFLCKPEYYNDDIYLNLFEKGESQIDDEISKGMSQISQDIITKIDFDRIANIRKRNSKQILDGLKTLGIETILPIPSDKTPLFIPIWLKDRNKVRKQMFQHRIFCPIHWSLDGINVQKGLEMSDHEMSIIIDQRYTNKDMDLILDILDRALK